MSVQYTFYISCVANAGPRYPKKRIHFQFRKKRQCVHARSCSALATKGVMHVRKHIQTLHRKELHVLIYKAFFQLL